MSKVCTSLVSMGVFSFPYKGRKFLHHSHGQVDIDSSHQFCRLLYPRLLLINNKYVNVSTCSNGKLRWWYKGFKCFPMSWLHAYIYSFLHITDMLTLKQACQFYVDSHSTFWSFMYMWLWEVWFSRVTKVSYQFPDSRDHLAIQYQSPSDS